MIQKIDLPKHLSRYVLLRTEEGRYIVKRKSDGKTLGERTTQGVWRALNHGRIRVILQIKDYVHQRFEAPVTFHLESYGT